MEKRSPAEELNAIRKEGDALDQSIALNRIVMAMLDAKRREDFWLRILLIISLLANIAIAGIFIAYESQMITTTTTTTTTVEQDTGEGSGNNVYQSGERASYTQEGVNSDGEADNNYSDNETNPKK